MCTDWWVRHDINIDRGWKDKNSSVRKVNMRWLLLRMDLYHQPLLHLLVLPLLISIYLKILMRDENATVWTWTIGIFRVQDWCQPASDTGPCLSILHIVHSLCISALHISLKVKQGQITVHLQYFSIVWFHGAETARCIGSKLGQAPLPQIKPCRFWCWRNHSQLIFQEVHKQSFPAAWQDLCLIRYHCSLGIAGEKNTC